MRSRWSPERRRTLLLLALVVLPWLNSFGGVFVFDDDRLIRGSELIERVLPLQRFLAGKRPVLELSLALNHAVSGLATWSYHLVNLLVHLAAVLLLRDLLRRLLEASAERPAWLAAPDLFACAVALLWGVHPVQTETVTYVVQRAESLASLGYLGAIWAYLRARDAARPWPFLVLAALSAWFGMMAKSIVVTLPATLLLVELALRRGRPGASWRTSFAGILLVASSSAWVFLSGLFTGATKGVHGGRAAVGFTLTEITPFQYLMSQAGAIWGYLRLVVSPFGLCLDHGREATTALADALLPGLGVLLLLALVILAWRRAPLLGLAGAFFFVVLAPTSSFVPIRDVFVEHRIYLAMAGPLALLVALACRILPSVASRRGALVLAFFLFAILTVLRNADYHDERGMWEDVVAKAPRNPRGHYSLGVLDARDGRFESAIRRARETIALDPKHALAHVLVASSEFRLGRFAAAEEAARAAIAIDDDMPIAYSNLGDALDAQGRIDEAIAAHRKAIKAKKKFPSPHVDLAELLVKKGLLDEAEKSLANGFERGADRLPQAWQLKGVIARRRGRFEEAIAAYRRALAMLPALTEARLNLAISLQAAGRLEEARREVEQVLEAETDSKRALLVHGVLATRLGDFATALRDFERAETLFVAEGQRPPAAIVAETARARARLAGLERHEAVVAAKGEGLGPAELAIQAEIALGRGDDRAAVALGFRALAGAAEIAADLDRALRFRLARAALRLAQAGETGLYEPALGMMEADLELREAQIARGGAEADAARSALFIWKADPTLSGLFGDDRPAAWSDRMIAFAARIDRALGGA